MPCDRLCSSFWQMLEGHALGQVLEAVEVDRSTCLVLQRDREYLEHQDYAAAEEDRLCIEAGRRDFERMQRTWRQRQNLSRCRGLRDRGGGACIDGARGTIHGHKPPGRHT